MPDAESIATSGLVEDEDASEAQAQIIASLRAQVTDLFSQVTQLNGKLVASYDRMSDLEDQFHDASSSLRKASVTISSLELERSHHLAALNTGLLVEKAHVTAELNRLMERATEEAAQRGQAESARHDIEKDLDDLSATLFDQANTMVAEARLNQAKSDRKVQDAEQALKIAEDAVKDMQVQMQTMQTEKEAAERGAQEARVTMGKGKWVERDDARVGEVPRIRFMTAHTPYAEFVAFVTHLRGLRVSQPTPPVISTLLSQPFIARLLAEDSEPTVRLDLAPSLNWLSRRSVLAAIHTGMLTVEPVPFPNLVQELNQHPQLMSTSSLSCALCGTVITRISPTTPVSRSNNVNGGSWFKYPRSLGSTHNHNVGTPQLADCEPPGQLYIFRLATPSATPTPPVLSPAHTSSASTSAVGTSSRSLPNTLPPSRMLQPQTQNSPYPLCTSNYCMTRLRSTCSLWAFVRVGIVERIWEEEGAHPTKHAYHDSQEKHSPATTLSSGNPSPNSTSFPSASEKPPVPPRRRRLWEMASALGLGERAVSRGKENAENIREKETETEGAKNLPPPPSHPSAPHLYAGYAAPREIAQDPPPLPKRSVIRDRTMSDTVVHSSNTPEGTAAPETKAPPAEANDYNEPDKADSNPSGFATPVDEITFAAPTSETTLPPPLATSHPAATEEGAPAAQGPTPLPSPHTVPLPMTPTTPNPVSRATSPAPRSQPRRSSPTSPPSSSRPGSPTINRSHAGSPVPTTVARVASPSPGHTSPTSHIRRKAPMPLLLASSRPASPVPATGPGAPPLPRRAPARRAVPPPPPSGPRKAIERCKEEVSPVATSTTADPVCEANGAKAGEPEAPSERKSSDGERGTDVVEEANVSQAPSVPAPTTQAEPESAKDAGTVDDANIAHENVERGVNGTSAAVVPESAPPRASEANGRTSVDTTRTKHSSSTEGEGFASDSTWEERTWKELVRLKEDMFWARIGGIRAPQG